MAALSLAAVGGTGREAGLRVPSQQSLAPESASAVHTYVALAADHLVAVELGGQSLQRGLNNTTTETEDQV